MYGEEGNIKLIDFGLSIVTERRTQKLDVCGTPYYIAPEVFNEIYGSKVDVWSLGVVLYQLLTGNMPFDGRSRAEVFAKIRSGEFEIPESLSRNCVDFLRKMMCVNPDERISASDAL